MKKKVKDCYYNATWIFRELITLKEFEEVIKSLHKEGVGKK